LRFRKDGKGGKETAGETSTCGGIPDEGGVLSYPHIPDISVKVYWKGVQMEVCDKEKQEGGRG